LDVDVLSTHADYNHRDVCLYFGYQSPTQFYYVHLGKKADPHANQIFIVNNKARTKISTKTTSGTDWDDQWHKVRIKRDASSGKIEVYFDDMKQPVMTATDRTFAWGQIGLGSFDDTADWDNLVVDGKAYQSPANKLDSNYPRTIDLNGQRSRQVVVDREKGQYLGHPTTCLLEDGKTILCVYPKGHGRGAIVYKRSTDGGLTWSKRLATPKSWSTSKEVPTLHRVVDANGKKRIIMWSGLYPARLAVTEDDGKTWSELKKVGDWGGIVIMGFVEKLTTGKGHYLAMFHDDGRFFTNVPVKNEKRTMTLYKTFSKDGGLTWSFPQAVFGSSEVHLCEPGCIRSPDGKKLAVLLRENARGKNSHVIFSADEGKTWSEPRELPLSLTGDRHTGKYGPDGRLFISFRCRSPKHLAKDRPFEGDWVGWVGTWDDIEQGRNGQYSVRLKDNTKGYDTTYPGVEVLPDGTFVTTTYGHWDQGEQPYILSVRFKFRELDELAK
jgi:photosystem II stability/assembly factor-like uncharacterized protein